MTAGWKLNTASSVRQKFLVPTLVVLFVGLAVIGTVSFSIVEKAVVENALLAMQGEVKSKINGTVKFHEKAQSDLLLAMEHPVFVEYFQLPEVKAGNHHDANQVLTFSSEQQAVKERMDQWILALQRRFPIVETCLIDQHGQEHARITNGKIAPNDDFSSDESGASFFKPTMSLGSNQVYVSHPYMSMDAHKWVFSYTAPVILPDGSKPGLFHYEIPVAHFQKTIAHGKEGSRYLIIDPTGYVVADSMQDIPLDLTEGEDPEQSKLSDYLPSIKSISEDPAFLLAVEAMAHEKEGFARFRMAGGGKDGGSKAGVEHYITYQPLPTFGWSLAHIRPYDALLEGKSSLSGIRTAITLVALAILLATAWVLWLVAARVTGPLTLLRESARQIAQGQLDAKLPEISSNDEVGDLTQAFAQMAGNLRQVFRTLAENAEKMTTGASSLQEASQTFASGSELLNDKSGTVSAAMEEISASLASVSANSRMSADNMTAISASAEEANTNLETIAQAAEEATISLATVASATEEAATGMQNVNGSSQRAQLNVETVATAAKELSTSIRQIDQRCRQAVAQSNQAAGRVAESRQVMEDLTLSARSIEQVVELINAIADQTHMLALNASIEAAGAGTAGRGFSVVAAEVKDLARQTAESTAQIREKVTQIQAQAAKAATTGHEVAAIMQEVSQANGEIAQAVAEQEPVVAEIARAMGETAGETGEVSRQVAEASEGIEEITRNATEVAAGIAEVTRQVAEATIGIAEVTRNVTESSAGSQEITRHVSELALGAEEISKAMAEVKRSVDGMHKESGVVAARAVEMGAMADGLKEILARFRF